VMLMSAGSDCDVNVSNQWLGC